MTNGLYLALILTLIPLALVFVALTNRPLLVLPHRLVPRLSEDTAYAGSLVTLALLGTVLEIFLALQFAFSSGGVTFPPTELLQLNAQTLYLALILFGVPLTVVGLFAYGERHLNTASNMYALGMTLVVILAAGLEVWLLLQLALA